MDIDFDFPEVEKEIIVENSMMKWAIKRLLKVHSLGGFAAWVGRSGVGKTTTAQKFVRLAKEKYDPCDPRSFHAVHYEVGRSAEWSKHEMKRGVRSLYVAVGYRIDEGVYRSYLVEELAADLVHFLIKMNIRVIFVDEAGILPLNALRGMVLVSDTAKLKNWTLSIVLIGMDDLPKKLTKLPQLERRVVEWGYFKPYSISETHALLSALHPFFLRLYLSNSNEKKIIEFIHNKYMGLPGGIVPFIGRFAHFYDQFPNEDGMSLVQAAYLLPITDKLRSIKDYNGDYKISLKNLMGDSEDTGNPNEPATET